jgi:signal transduction histidine kinase
VTGGARVAVVDDNEAARFVKCQTLRRAGFTVLEGATGADALRFVERERPDIFVLDVNLPDISGLEVTRRLRLITAVIPAVQILQISSTAVGTADRVRGLEQGADVYLTEPVAGEVLVATVQAMLRVQRAEAALAMALESERRSRAAAEEANRLKDEFIATLSHELRTPLNALMGWIWQLRHSRLDASAEQRALDSIERNTRIQAQLINDLLDISRASRGKLPLEMRLVDLQNVVAAAVESVREVIERNQLHLRLDVVAALVSGDQARLQQVVTNLLTNAIQYTPADGAISVRLSVDDDQAVVMVEDTGAGIEPSFLPYVFDQFRQGEGLTSRKHGGLGLGLSVVRQLVELHGGTVGVSSAGAGRGATFTVCLPRERVLNPAAFADDQLLLDDVSVRITAAGGGDPHPLAAVLESSGAIVTIANPQDPAPASPTDVDVLINVADADGALTIQPAHAAAPSASVPRTTAPAEIVRRIAYLIAERPRTSASSEANVAASATTAAEVPKASR